MELMYPEEHFSCSNYISNIRFGFKLLTLSEGEVIKRNCIMNHFIVFLLAGKIDIYCNDFPKKRLVSKEFIFISQSSSLACEVLVDSRLIVFYFSGSISSLCENSNLLSYSFNNSDFQYDFKSLIFNEPLNAFLELFDIYLQGGLNCSHMHDLKRNELFILFRSSYSKKEMFEFFFPIIGVDIDFRSKVLEKYQFGYNIKKISTILAVSTTYFSRKFKQEFGVTFHKWTTMQKAKHTRYRLSFAHTTITDIIHDLGFSSASHFTKFCKSEFGCTPTELVRQLRGVKCLK